MRNKLRFRTLIAAAMLIGIAALIAPTRRIALAHANLISSSPALGSVVETSPEVVTLVFSEAIDPEFSEVELRDTTGAVVIAGPGEVDADQVTMQLQTGDLPDGTYTAVWTALSLVDGHQTAGMVGFSVGLNSERASLLPAAGTPDPTRVYPTPLDALTRWLSYAASIIALGPLAFALLVWRSAAAPVESDKSLSASLRETINIGSLLLIAATIVFTLVQVNDIANGLTAADLISYLTTRSGMILIMRIVSAGILAVLSRRLPRAGISRPVLWIAGLLIAANVLLTFSLTSHSAALNNWLLVIIDWLHIAAMITWVGGLIPLILAIRALRGIDGGGEKIRKLVVRFSLIAVISVIVLVASGIYRGQVLTKIPEAVTETTYGNMLIIKTAIVAVMLVFGAINLLILSPRLQSGESAVRWLGRSVRSELGLSLVVLLVTGILTSVAPGYSALEERDLQGFVSEERISDVNLRIRIAPFGVGENEFGVEIDDQRPGAAETEPVVVIRLEALGQDMGITQIEPQEAGADRYTVRGAYFTVPGTWRMTVIMRKRGFDDVQTAFDLNIGTATVVSNEPINPIPATEDSVAEGAELYQTWCASCHGETGQGDGPVAQTLNPKPADLTIHSVVGVHSDGRLFLWITDGYPGSQMPAFKDFLTEDERWHLVNYIRTLSSPGN